ncbi:MAG: hypothetical protein ACOCW1_00635 [Chitinispirillaceae bacterium]
MKRCAYCGTDILFVEGRTVDGLHFCNSRCASHAPFFPFTDQVTSDELDDFVNKIYKGNCPVCNKRGPVNFYLSHRISSALVMSSWGSRHKICCRRCGTKMLLLAMFRCFFLGWWNFPWGVIMTPVQIIRNSVEILNGYIQEKPSGRFRRALKLKLAKFYMEKRKKEQEEEERELVMA